MFQIATSKINQNLVSRKKKPVFNLKFQETFENHPEDQISIDEGEDVKSELTE